MKLLAPERIDGWSSSGADRRFGPKTIFDYLNGGAEVYLDYAFKSLFVREYQKPRNPPLTLLIFDMSSAQDAFGIFTLEREGETAGVGLDSDVDPGLLRFWRGRYFVSVLSERPTPASQRAILALGRTVAAKITAPGRRPATVSWLPADGLDPASVRFLHTHRTLSHHLPEIAERDLLGLDRSTGVVLADYRLQPRIVRVVIVVYPQATRATRAATQLSRNARPAHSHRVCGRVLTVVLGPDPRPRKQLLDRVVANIAGCTHGP